MKRKKVNTDDLDDFDNDITPEEEEDDQNDDLDKEDEFKEDIDDDYLNDRDLGLGMDDFGATPMEKHDQLLQKLTNFNSYIRQLYNVCLWCFCQISQSF